MSYFANSRTERTEADRFGHTDAAGTYVQELFAQSKSLLFCASLTDDTCFLKSSAGDRLKVSDEIASYK